MLMVDCQFGQCVTLRLELEGTGDGSAIVDDLAVSVLFRKKTWSRDR